MKKTLAIDEDMLVYRIGYGVKDYDSRFRVESAIWQYLIKLCLESGHTQFILCRSDKTLWRSAMYPLYKATRKHNINPWRAYVKEYLTEYCLKVESEEADDIMASLAAQKEGIIICTNDKDLRQVPGEHMKFSGDKATVTKEEGNFNFCLQLLMGDNVDNIPGIPGIGLGRGKKALEKMEVTEENCLRFYLEKNLTIEYYTMMYRLMKMKTDLDVSSMRIITLDEIRKMEEPYG